MPRVRTYAWKVFPAQAGMNRLYACPCAAKACVPRTGGDEPQSTAVAYLYATCSPHRRDEPMSASAWL